MLGDDVGNVWRPGGDYRPRTDYSGTAGRHAALGGA